MNEQNVQDPLAPPPPPADTPKAEEPAPKVFKKPSSKKATSKPKVQKFRAKSIPFYHPYQKVTIPVTHGVPLEVDSWVQVQVDAGVLEESS